LDYAIPDLYLAASPDSKTKLLTGFKAAPFVEPATGLAYFRARWYDPATGTFLTPDPMGYRDSSNLYAAFGNDPVNQHDPTGLCLGFDDIPCGDYATDIFLQFGPQNAVGNAKRSARFLVFELKGAALAIPRAVGGVYHVATHLPETVEGIAALAEAVADDPEEMYRRAVNGIINANPDQVAEFTGETLFFAGAGAAVKTTEGAAYLSKARALLRADEVADATTSMSRGAALRAQYGKVWTEYRRMRELGYSVRASKRLAQPYTGVGHHFVFQSVFRDTIRSVGPNSRAGRLVRSVRDNPLNLKSGRGMSTAEFYEFHARAHGLPAFGRTRPAQGMRLFPGEPWQASRVPGLQPFNRLEYIWHASPLTLKLTVGGGVLGGGYLATR
jgi:RHS repeat-associated protein